ncbi:MAG: T9SS type A sorting domain-containing protein [Flavobacteriales bacterium]
MRPIAIILLLLSNISISLAQGTFCNTAGNIFLFTNYDGGTLNINVNQNISNIKIGVVSYEAVTITISGTYASNVTEVRYAGYNSNNTNCGATISSTTISGAGSAATSITFAPASTLSNTNGYSSIICGYSCGTTSYQGGCNTVDQVEDYWLSIFSGASINMHRVQYGCWSGTQNLSAGGDCCALAVSLAAQVTSTDETCNGSCDGTAQAIAGGGQAPYSYSWSNGASTANISTLCGGTYTVTVTDNNGATVTESATIAAAVPLSSSQTLELCFGESVVVGSSTYSSSGVYIDTLISATGCDSIVTTDLTVYPDYSYTQIFTPTVCDGFSITVGTHTYTQTGIYKDTLISSTGCDSVVTTTITLSSVSLISQQPSNVSVTAGATASMSIVASATATALQWQENSGTGFVNLSDAGQYSGTSTDQLSISATTIGMNNYLYRCLVSEDMCQDTSSVSTLTVKKPAGIISTKNQDRFSVYPNPAQTILTIKPAAQTEPGTVRLFDLRGELITSTSINGRLELDASDLPSGSYILEIKTSEIEYHRVSIVK